MVLVEHIMMENIVLPVPSGLTKNILIVHAVVIGYELNHEVKITGRD